MKRFLFKGPYGTAIVAVVRRRYVNGNLRIELLDEEGYPYAIASTNIPSLKLGDDEIVVKDYSENKGILAFLLQHNIVELTSRAVRVGMELCEICRVTPENRWVSLSPVQLAQLRTPA